MAKWFKESEFECRCKCGLNNWGTEHGQSFIERLDKARGLAGAPFIINSGCRCTVHNKAIGSSPTSSHLNIAADIRATTSTLKFIIVRALMDAGFTRIFLYHDRSHIHVDMDENKSQPALRAY